MRLEAVLTSSDGPAVEWGDEKLSYRALDQLANRMARCLLAAGVGRGDRVGLHLPRCGRGVAAMLAVLRIGAAYVPLDASSPAARLLWIAQDCALRLVVTLPKLLPCWELAPEPRPHLLLVASLGDRGEESGQAPGMTRWTDVLRQSHEALPSCDGTPDELAYILYTSGSTGTPKGVMLSHRNALAFVHWAAEQVSLTAGERVASVAPFHFDLSVFDIWGTLSRNATLVILDETTVTSGARMLRAIHERRVQVWYSVPSALMLMLESGLEALGASSLRAVLFAGEVFPMAALRRVMAALPRARFHNLFGPTETNVCLAYALPGIPAPESEAIPIGHAACGDLCSVLDEQGEPVPHGTIGELHVEGPTVMLGYWERSGSRPRRQPYPTGDLVSQREDGVFMYHGRRDHRVKVHGFRVDLSELEATLHAHSLIREAVVVVLDQRLIALVVRHGSALSVMDVRRHCAAKLPRYMLPSEVHFVSALPRTSTGKVDRVHARALPRVDAQGALAREGLET